ncbi:MAG: hypothetical protein IJV55_04710, partial [Paludibacteraceae bacterium]|nr:hypothetical protein [Paludibacteraceae bacterium]
MEWLAPLGDEGSQPYFVYIMQPGEYSKYPEGKTDNTHLRLRGALEVGREFAVMVKEQRIAPLCNYINLDSKAVKYTTPCGVK